MRYPPPIHLTVSTIFLFLSVLVTPPAQAQEAYFSFTGQIADADDQPLFLLEFARDIATTGNSAENVSFRTWTSAGGTNAAGETIAASSFDSELLFAFDNNEQSVTNDDGGDGRDAWLTNAGLAANGDALPAIIPSGLTFVRLSEFNNDATGPIAVDLVGPADAMVLRGSDPDGNISSLNSLAFGTTGIGPSNATLEITQGTVVIGGLTVGVTGNATLEIDDATLDVNGEATIRSGGTANVVVGGRLETGFTVVQGRLTVDATSVFIPSRLIVDGGELVSSGVFILPTDTANPDSFSVILDGGQMQTANNFSVTGTASITDEGSWSHAGAFNVGFPDNFGDLTVSGNGSVLNVDDIPTNQRR